MTNEPKFKKLEIDLEGRLTYQGNPIEAIPVRPPFICSVLPDTKYENFTLNILDSTGADAFTMSQPELKTKKLSYIAVQLYKLKLNEIEELTAKELAFNEEIRKLSEEATANGTDLQSHFKKYGYSGF